MTTIEDLIGTAGIEVLLREELETAWLRGWKEGQIVLTPTEHPGLKRVESPEITPEIAQHAADYAERVIGGSTRPERPEVE